jgi:hypothetical protein
VNELRRVFINCHVPKTAGTTLIDGFYQLFGRENCLIQSDIADSEFPTTILNTVDEKVFFSGHISLKRLLETKGLLAKRDIDVQIISSIREAITHFLSVFLHSQRFGNLSEADRTVPLGEFLMDRGRFAALDSLVSNSVTKYYSGDQKDFTGEASFAAAKQDAKEINFLFNADKLEQSFEMFAERYELLGRPKIARLNENVRNNSRWLLENYHLLPAVAEANKFDCALYGELAQRWAEAATRDYSSLKAYSEDEGKSLGEGLRRADYKIQAENESLVQFIGNDMMIHPPARGMSEISAPAVFEANGYLKIASGVSLSRQSLSGVMVCFEIFCGESYTCHTKMMHPGEEASISFEMTNVFGPCDVRLSSYLKAGSESPNYAILKLLNPRFILEV